MGLIDETYFIGELNLPNTNDEDVQERLEHFITKYEAKFLKELLGYGLYKDFTAGLAAGTVDPKWTKLKDGGEYTVNGKVYWWDGLVKDDTSMIANFVYYWWMRNEVTQTAGIGEVATKSENSVRVSPDRKMRLAWSQMVEQSWNMVRFIESDLSIYPSWDRNNIYGYDQYQTGWRMKDIFQHLPLL